MFVPNTIYIITGATLHKQNLFLGAERLNLLQSVLFGSLSRQGWELRAWAVLSNHYHMIVRSPACGSVSRMIRALHAEAGRRLNRLDGQAGRQVLYQYWDKCLTLERSYYARLNYVNQNPVRHGVVRSALLYPYCSARLFMDCAPSPLLRKLASFGYEQVNEPDDFDVKCGSTAAALQGGSKLPHSAALRFNV